MRRAAFYSSLSLLILQQLASAKVLRLTEDNFEEKTMGKTVFIKFFAPWCGHCKAMASDWEKLADEWEGHEVGLVAEVDCTAEDGESVCADYDVEGYPTLMYGDPLSPDRYEGGRDYESMSEFAKDNISKPFCSIKKMEACSEEETKIITDLKAKSLEELKEIETEVEEKIEASEAEFEDALEKLTKEYEDLVEKNEEDLEKIRTESNYKWVMQIISSLEGDATMGEEL